MQLKKIYLLSLILFVFFSFSACTNKVTSVENQEIMFETPYGTQKVIYSGKMVDNMPNGKGHLSFEVSDTIVGGTEYDGIFSDGKLDGEGTLTGFNSAFMQDANMEGIFTDTNEFNGTFYVDGHKVYKGEMLAGKNSSDWTGFSISDYIFSGEGTLYDGDGNIVYEGKFNNNNPIEKSKFESQCRELTLKNVHKYSQSKRFSLVKLKSGNNPYIAETSSHGWGMLSAHEEWDCDVWVQYKYGEKEDILVDGDTFIAYGILAGTVEGYDSPLIVALCLEEK